MKREIQKAYQTAAPERAELVRMYKAVLNRAEAAPERTARSASPLRRLRRARGKSDSDFFHFLLI